ncbi:ABC transporter ATP-binding protein [Paradesulfitobacterium ferrireducens]|uniref:ABC transporter ATP-binding protein n=1 Tax=Paradesulfitobacterium ferrireducens TaxID=2816476 RepID=UPI001A8F8280|nr:ABC transporter ATP-binding protein [Paradesulfitobacterium ferrireducens]
MILKLDKLSLSFGGIQALNGVSFEIKEGELFSLIGPNGAGKTSVINAICSFYKPTKGEIYFKDKLLNPLKPYNITALGVSRTFQNTELFAGMSVLDNIKLGSHNRLKASTLSGMFHLPWAKKEEREEEKYLREEILKRLGLDEVRNRFVGTLPYGLQKRVDLGRALASRPELLILDEPVAGMNNDESRDMVECLLHFKKAWNLTILLVEHDMEVVMSISDRIVVMNFGQKIAEGTPQEIQNNEQVITIYLGKQYEKDVS